MSTGNTSINDLQTSSLLLCSSPKAPRDTIVPAWPTAPRQLRQNSTTAILGLLGDLVLCLVPLLFLVLGISAALLNGERLSSYGRTVERALLLSPTVFPIVFAAIIGRFLKAAAQSLGELGTTLGTLEQMNGCMSVFTAIERQILIHRFTLLGASIVTLWCLSPLGGQSTLRLLSQVPAAITTTKSLAYLGSNNLFTSPLTSEDEFYVGYQGINFISAPYLASLMAPQAIRSSPLDLWGNVKVPLLRELLESGNDGWRNVPNNGNTSFSSLIGIPLANSTSNGQWNFTVQSNYADMTCSSNTLTSAEAFVNSVVLNRDYFDNEANTSAKVTALLPQSDNGTKPEDSLVGTYPTFFLVLGEVDGRVWFGSLDKLADDDGLYSNGTMIALANCTLNDVFVESQVLCSGDDCRVVALRRIQDPDSEQWNYNIESVINSGTFEQIGTFSSASTITELFMNNPEKIFGSSGLATLDDLTPKEISNRLTVVFNTFWQASMAPEFTFQHLLAPVVDNYYETATNLTSVTATVTQSSGQVYRINYAWLSVLLVVSLVMELCAVGAMILKHRSLSPDIFGYVSSLTRDNPFFAALAPGGSSMDALERARHLSSVTVQVRDVSSGDRTGHIAFIPLSSISLKSGERLDGGLKMGRMYD